MKTYKNFDLVSDSFMDYTLNCASKRKTTREEVQDVIAHKEETKQQMRDDLKNRRLKKWIHKAYIRYDGVSKKQRIIVPPSFSRTRPEQWWHYIAIKSIQPIIVKGSYFYSCGSLPNKGVHFGKKYLAKFIKNRPKDIKYCLKIDVRHFYPNIDTNILKYKLERIIKNDDLIYLLFWVIDNNVALLPDGTIISGGLTVGGYPSQWFANFFMQDFDHYMKEVLKVKFYMRYMDDIIVLSSNKKELRKVLEEIRKQFKILHLELKSNYQIFKFDYTDKFGKTHGRFIDFMGFKFYRSKTTIRKSTFLRACKTARKIRNTKLLTLKRAYKIVSYKGWFDDTNSFQAYQKHIKANVNIQSCKRLISKESKRGKNGNQLQNVRKQHKTA